MSDTSMLKALESYSDTNSKTMSKPDHDFNDVLNFMNNGENKNKHHKLRIQSGEMIDFSFN